ncbi:thioesterase superfamily protein [Protomyces lactucae-debilis]|uniref:Thioesterase superfamily protein n=1 Tax=Protomyces lactucae-debilis TaxID=2754530 RepID=A0A1Y2F955_PROLT|nr:thioesterase superfamily protein [Protomyces lactucae-debilis]ORY80448.1 thioesterase superfamily protein [Protomyces lactucae-debilis]
MTEHKDLAYYKWQTKFCTRFGDNDQYGHVNNSKMYEYFDAIANKYLILHAGLDPQSATEPIGLVIASGCRYFAPLEFPDELIGGLTVGKLGKTSVTYHIAVFKEGNDTAAAAGHFTHVFVNPKTRRPVPIKETMRDAFLTLLSSEAKAQL